MLVSCLELGAVLWIWCLHAPGVQVEAWVGKETEAEPSVCAAWSEVAGCLLGLCEHMWRTSAASPWSTWTSVVDGGKCTSGPASEHLLSFWQLLFCSIVLLFLNCCSFFTCSVVNAALGISWESQTQHWSNLSCLETGIFVSEEKLKTFRKHNKHDAEWSAK